MAKRRKQVVMIIIRSGSCWEGVEKKHGMYCELD